MPSRNILVINCGSSSIKFALVNEAHSMFPCTSSPSAARRRDAVLRWKRGGDSDRPDDSQRRPPRRPRPVAADGAERRGRQAPRASATGWCMAAAVPPMPRASTRPGGRGDRGHRHGAAP
ncbi:hypothetical protein ACPA9J_10470 [Pseudomonas aeruginosa]